MSARPCAIARRAFRVARPLQRAPVTSAAPCDRAGLRRYPAPEGGHALIWIKKPDPVAAILPAWRGLHPDARTPSSRSRESFDEALPSLRRAIWFGPPSSLHSQFCTARCLEIWKCVQSDKARQARFLEWLLPGTASLTARPASIPARNDAWGGLHQVHRRV